MRRIFGYLVVLGVCLGSWQPAMAQDLFAIGFAGPDGPATFFSVNRTTGAATAIGPVGFERCSGMDVSSMGTVVATCERSPSSATPVLVTIDPTTGAGTEIGPLGNMAEMTDISFQPGTNILFGTDSSETVTGGTNVLFTISTATGAATVVGATGLPFGNGQAMGFDQAGTLFHTESLRSIPDPPPDLNTINPMTGVGTVVRDLLLPASLPPDLSVYRFNAMDFDPISGLFFAILNDGSFNSGSVRRLTTIDPTTGIVTVLGLTDDSLDAIACRGNAVPVELQQFVIE